ncbi:DUF4865 family protein [Bacillus cytotoxicus]|uniref:DUF4865 domain-containing protein n=2 Tax=Bacillus TaxID=1386 RepID=A7GPJ2_BACCN|nr:DUF4865 family protein [Bacillus cytotoxicus]ABS22050.1 conserved hypothetical protein [Bacillus cytotoxicus NVH 391-98]AWC44731.1 DUF4865 domain-containing protein [Bacillus cytotoxicus]MDH2864247.1 DUF4865 family protein [Bacillus cytotoxicus]MDH2885215.1 DUF4865 family protein [Bacillus cytotoxicus]NZD32873.1 DUF4865 family protein [Bacillus cytotoxicus]
MIGMQYKIILPKDYDMEIIRQRVKQNGHKTDGFQGLNFKVYLITEAVENKNLYNSYAPLYIWNNHEGMNKFIFDGFYDNILESFGWQQINIGVPLSIHLDKNFNNSRYVVEYTGNISKSKSLSRILLNTNNQYVNNAEKSLGNVLVYNPDKWGYSQFSFYREKPEFNSLDNLKLYEVLYISQ